MNKFWNEKLFPSPYNPTLTLSNGEGRVGKNILHMGSSAISNSELNKQRLEAMMKWTREDFDFYADFYEGAGLIDKSKAKSQDERWKDFQKAREELEKKK